MALSICVERIDFVYINKYNFFIFDFTIYWRVKENNRKVRV